MDKVQWYGPMELPILANGYLIKRMGSENSSKSMENCMKDLGQITWQTA